MFKVGVTGGIGSGKSKVCELLAERGVAIYDSDSRAKALMSYGTPLAEKIVARFGDECYREGGLNRAWLAERVFAHPAELAALNGLVHPAVIEDFNAWAEQQSGCYVVMESAILFEANLDNHLDVTVAVMAPESLRLERAMARDGVSREQIEARMRNQMGDAERVERARYAIVNISLDRLDDDVEQLHRKLCYDSKSFNHRL